MKHRKIILTLVCAGGLIIWFTNWNPPNEPCFPSRPGVPQSNGTVSDRAGGSNLQSAGILKMPVAGQNNIFFVESSCAVGGAKRRHVSMMPRQACAVESAALTNPNATVYYLDTCLRSSEAVGGTDRIASQVLRLPNVKVLSGDLARLAAGTPLETWSRAGWLLRSAHPVEHSSDVLRMVLLWKYGGTYLDLDFIFIRSLDDLGTDFAVAERDYWIANGVLSFSAEGLGHRVADRCLKELAAHFNGRAWSSNGPAIITNVLSTLCSTKSVTEMTRERCWGFTVYQPALFYPFKYQSWWLMFDEGSSEAFMAFVLKNSTRGIHAWNKMSSSKKVIVDSRQPFALLAKQFCPGVFSAVGLTF